MSSPIRVLRVVGRLDRGGLETIIMNAYRIIDREKLQFDFVVHTEDECIYNEEIRSLGGRIYSVPTYNGKNHFQYVKAWKEFFQTHPEYKVIHGHVRSTASIYLRIAKNFGLTTIAHSHNTSSGMNLQAIAKNVLQLPIRYSADYLFACSTPAGKWLFGENVVNKSNFKVIPNGIQSNKYIFNSDIREEVKKEFNITNEIVVGHIGRFHQQKNHSFLISVFKKIHEQNPNTILMLVGEGNLREKVTNQIKDYGLEDKVIMTGSRNDVHRLLQAMDIFVFPSHFEGFGNVIIEAQASGLPCVISNTIPSEVEVTNLVKFIDLDKSTDYWAKEVLTKINESLYRRDTSEEIIKAGFDVFPIAKWYEEFYIENTVKHFVNHY
ncbi:glycosyltransferase family 1 protein [Neobacillus sp. D3-1R]|uniref:glycosyltransferase family 1 protein n=1 Tax=Neobacillus sp. D3-1R TaxID=3445778 RepID=UPI003F9F0834